MRPSAKPRKGPVRHVFGGRLCLDFVNTLDAWSRPATRDDLPDYATLLDWSWQLRALPDDEIDALRRASARRRAEAALVHRQALDLRRLLHRVFAAAAAGTRVAQADVQRLDAWCAKARQRQTLVAGEPWKIELGSSPADLAAPLHAVALSAQELLTSADLSRVKACPGPVGCGWLFVDLSKNRSRRWCSMDHCGTKAKALHLASA